MTERRITRTVSVGGVKIGSGHPVSIQSMAKTDTSDVDGTVSSIGLMEEAGCEIVRLAVKDIKGAKAIADIKESINIPVVADIHFNYKLALEAIESGADKIRINPGNIFKPPEVDAVIDAARDKGIPLRIGANSGSLGPDPVAGGDTAACMVEMVLRYLEIFRAKKFEDIVISLKCSDVPSTVKAYRMMAGECDHPFHVGVTAAGSSRLGIVKGAMGIGALLLDGIGDTIRVSLTGDPVTEVYAARDILKASELRNFGPVVISCPGCGRCQVDLVPIVENMEEELRKISAENGRPIARRLTIAIMGCEVNGPGEAKSADIGVAFGKGKGAIFSRGEIIRTVEASSAVEELVKMIKDMY
jgi:(E)-4-hydroxy-3-methylbut-2-enyl-diphosphate synthase